MSQSMSSFQTECNARIFNVVAEKTTNKLIYIFKLKFYINKSFKPI